jgi:two-component system, response regulator, stage 0 sporulation protein F
MVRSNASQLKTRELPNETHVASPVSVRRVPFARSAKRIPYAFWSNHEDFRRYTGLLLYEDGGSEDRMLGEFMVERRILIVDDLEGVRMMLEDLFREEGYTVHTARNGQEALNLLDRIDVDVVLTDLEMPVVDGWQLAKIVRSRAMGIPLVAMTARGIVSGNGWGDFVAYLNKPFDFKSVLSTIDDAVTLTSPLDSALRHSVQSVL